MAADGGVAVVTGGGRGIGAAISRRLAADGYAVVVNYAGDAAAAGAVVRDIENGGGRAVACRADVSREDEVATLFAAADGLGRLAALVNNAGILGDVRRVEDHDEASLTRVLATNVIGPALCAKHAVRRLSTKHGGAGGSIVNVGSIAATTGGIAGMVAYAASKGAVASFTLGLAKEVAREGIRVNAVAPGMIVTDMTVGVAEQIAQSIPLGRCGEPEEIAAAVSWLLSPGASYAVGTVLTVSGGR